MLKEIKMMRASGRDPFGNKEDEQIKDVKEYDQIIEPKMPDRMRNTLGQHFKKKLAHECAKCNADDGTIYSHMSHKDYKDTSMNLLMHGGKESSQMDSFVTSMSSSEESPMK